MIIAIQIEITHENIRIDVPLAEFSQLVPNVVALNPKRQRVYGFGESREKIRQKAGERWDEFKDDLVFKPSFVLDAPDLDLDKYVLWRCMEDVHRHLRGSQGFKKLLHQVVDHYDVDVKIEGYENFTKERRQALEYFLQADLRARKLTINGKPVEISPRLRNLESWVRILFTLTVPYVLIGIGVFTVLGLPEEQLPWNNVLISMGLIFILGIVMETIGKAAWMLLMKRVVPASYLRHFLPRLPLQVVTKWMARALLKD